MNNYQRVLGEFSKLGYNENSYLTQEEVNRALDAISAQNAGYSEFDRSLSQELYEHCQETSRGVRLGDFVGSILEAEGILRDQIDITENAMNASSTPEMKDKYQKEYREILSDHRLVTQPFRLPPLKQQVSAVGSTLHTSPQNRMDNSNIFAMQANDRVESATDLKVCLFITVFMLLWELVLMFHKHHFLNLLCLFLVLSIYFLNYFDKNYIKFVLLMLAVSLALDIVWLGVNAQAYWNTAAQTQHSTLHSGFLAFIFIMVIILMVLKVVIGVILFKYRDNGQGIRKKVSVFGYRLNIDGSSQYNPFTPILRANPINLPL